MTTPEVWRDRRRPEIVEDFDREVYGRLPRVMPSVRWEVTGLTQEKVGAMAVTVKKLVGHVDNTAYPAITVAIQLTLTTPADAPGPVPVIMEFGFGGFGPRGPGAATKAASKAGAPPAGPTWQQQVLTQGWGYAILVPGSIQADNGAGLTGMWPASPQPTEPGDRPWLSGRRGRGWWRGRAEWRVGRRRGSGWDWARGSAWRQG